MLKKCGRCERELLSSEFHMDNHRKDNLNNWCKECRRAYNRGMYQKHREKRIQYYWDNHEKRLKMMRKSREKNRERYNESSRKCRIESFMKALNHLGGHECTRCGFDDVRALCIDHINDDGKKERQEKHHSTIWRDILELSSDEAKKSYQVLCRNCNWIKNLVQKKHGVEYVAKILHSHRG